MCVPLFASPSSSMGGMSDGAWSVYKSEKVDQKYVLVLHVASFLVSKFYAIFKSKFYDSYLEIDSSQFCGPLTLSHRIH